ncbi:DUF4041 domain-containing protein [Nostoc commune]|uniref:DUF4041 domain-containing protein n=1 Tax=Nostoc commune TaxID=1178 RepID=UPI0018C46F8A|nr:DUF4041 domain-containing protein [Nostoc commune]MBG1262993.1 DUF4041 domain-containing protein [Nostoc commune BAE]
MVILNSMSLTNLGLLVLAAGLFAALIQSLIAESRLRKRLSRYDGLDDKEAYQQQLVSNIYLLENQQESLNSQVINLQQQFNEINGKLYLQSIDAYEPKYEFISSDDYILRLKDIKLQQENMRKNNQAYICNTPLTFDNSTRKGDRMINDLLKLVELAFEERCKYAIKEVRYNNIDSLNKKINDAFEKYNKCLKTLDAKISSEYLQLKFIELDLQYELEDKKQQEQERDKEVRKQNKQREAIDRETKRAEDAEQRERLHQREIDKIRQELLQAKEQEKEQLETKIKELERLVAEDRSEKENAISESRRLKSGYIYIISNIGSLLGENIYRICMTSRGDEYIKEMNPNVPFQFDIHFKIFSEDALETLQNLHQRFNDKRVNIVNSRRDFFEVSIDEIEAAIKEIQRKSVIFLRIDAFEKFPKAYEYRQTLAARKKEQL